MIIGITNIIPFFGPFIGAIPSAIIILFVSPIQALWFLVIVLVIQQVDGNIIGPKILGNSTGLSSFWVLFSILFFGGLWGFVGMIIGVPFFAVVYDVITRLVIRGLRRKQREDMLMAYDEQYVKKSKITPRQEKLWSEEEKQELTQEKTEQKEQPESVINEGESDEDRKEL
mgnify:CR=1 FL=1